MIIIPHDYLQHLGIFPNLFCVCWCNFPMQRQSLQLEPILELVKPTINGYKTCFGSVGPSRRSCSFFIFLFLLENSNILFLLGFSFGCKLLEQASCRLANCIAILGNILFMAVFDLQRQGWLHLDNRLILYSRDGLGTTWEANGNSFPYFSLFLLDVFYSAFVHWHFLSFSIPRRATFSCSIITFFCHLDSLLEALEEAGRLGGILGRM